MAVLGVTAFAVGTTTTKTSAQSGSTGRTTGGGPSSTASPHRSATRVASSTHTTVERSTTTGLASIVAPLPADHGRSPQYWPVALPEVLIREIVAPAVVIAAATVATEPDVAGVGPVATSAATPFVVPAAPPVTLRPVVVVETPAAVTAAPSSPVVERIVIERPVVVGCAAAMPIVMTSAVFALAVASGLAAAPVRSAEVEPAEPAAGAAPVAASSGGSGLPPALADSSSPTPAPADPLQTAAGPQLSGPPASPTEVAGAQAGPDQGAGSGPITGGTAGDADAQALSARSTSTVTPSLTGGTAAEADASALRARPSVGAEPAPPVPPIAIGSTVAFETAAASIDSTDAAAALQLAQALDASGKGFHSVSWREDERSNAAVLRLGAAEAWSRHEKERAELFADARSASAGLRAQTGFDQLLVRQLVGGD